jgi:uncharacterized BrkB/YihY/UPF0761 family membrane protein
MKEKILYGIWACLYIICVGFGFIPEPAGFGKAILVLIGISFFVPGAIVLYDGIRQKNRKAVVRIRVISIISLLLTLIFIVVNVMAVNASQSTAEVLFEILALVSSPMICCQYWAVSLFLWACLLSASVLYCPKKNRK